MDRYMQGHKESDTTGHTHTYIHRLINNVSFSLAYLLVLNLCFILLEERREGEGGNISLSCSDLKFKIVKINFR